LKTLPEREFVSLRSILKNYLDHLIENSDSLIAKFFGMFKLEWEDPDTQTITCKSRGRITGPKNRTAYVVVMDNLFKSFEVGIRFDLKGSDIGRTRLKRG